MKRLKINIVVSAVIVIGFIFTSCEDTAPMDYVKKNLVEAYLIVDQPIEKIKILESQPLAERFDYKNSYIKDADVKIIKGVDTLQLLFNSENNDGYFYPDTNLKVMPETKYKLLVTLKDGTIMTGETSTPSRFQWDTIKHPKKEIYYPKDTLKLPKVDSLTIGWTTVPNVNFFILSVKCLDTLNYGIYLKNPSNEPNRRCYSVMNNMDIQYRETSSWNFIANTETPTVWLAFKWFGLQEIIVYAADKNMINWMIQTMSVPYDPLMSSIKGGEGVFGSASTVKEKFFLYKNQP